MNNRNLLNDLLNHAIWILHEFYRKIPSHCMTHTCIHSTYTHTQNTYSMKRRRNGKNSSSRLCRKKKNSNKVKRNGKRNKEQQQQQHIAYSKDDSQRLRTTHIKLSVDIIRHIVHSVVSEWMVLVCHHHLQKIKTTTTTRQ